MSNLRNTQFYVVWGMHRSGTSMIARALECFGADLGNNLFRADQGNPKGYFEDENLLRLNETMLRKIDKSWRSITPVTQDDINILIESGYMQMAIAFLDSKAAAAPIVALKDPRMTRLALFWKRVFEETGIKPVSFITFRNPQDVAASLIRRARACQSSSLILFPEYSYLLWLGYTWDSLEYTKDWPRILINYEQFLEEPEHTIRASGIRLNLEVNLSELITFCQDFMDRKLNHGSGIYNASQMPPMVHNLYTFLKECGYECPMDINLAFKWPNMESDWYVAKLLDAIGCDFMTMGSNFKKLRSLATRTLEEYNKKFNTTNKGQK